MKRESFRSRLGFLLVSAGCAIGIGNVWRFPYVTGKNGGGYFVLFYILCLLIMGVPVLTMELAVGRASHKSAILAYKTLEKPKSKWHIHGWFCLIGCYLLMMYYTTVSGWMVSYFGRFLTGKFYSGMPAEDASAVFGQLLSDPVEMGILAVAIVIVGFIVCSFGLQKGLERVSKVMMLALLALILILAVHSLTLSGAAEGMKFYLLPSLDSIRENGLRSLITDAMNQAFFTLSLGIAAMEIFGSYMSDDHTLAGESIRICALDTFVALMAGTIIFPACFSYGVAPDNGPSLLFVTLPQVFVNMSGGRFWGTLFFLFMIFASISTVLAVFENILAICMDTFGISRRKAVLINGILIAAPQSALRVRLQHLERLPSHPRQGRARQRGLPREQPPAAHRLARLPPLLRDKVGLGLRQVSCRGQQGRGHQALAQAQALFPVGAADPDRHHPAPRPAVNLLFSHLSYLSKGKSRSEIHCGFSLFPLPSQL